MLFKSIRAKISTAILIVFSICTLVSVIFYVKVNDTVWSFATLFIVIGAVVFIILLFFIRRIIIKRIEKIEKIVHTASSGDLEVFIDPDFDDEEKVIEIKEAERDTVIRENQKYLLNMQEGMLMVDYGQIISGKYSHYLVSMFDRREIAGQHLSDFIYPDKSSKKEDQIKN